MSSNLIPSSRALILNYDLVSPTGLLKGFPVRIGIYTWPVSQVVKTLLFHSKYGGFNSPTGHHSALIYCRKGPNAPWVFGCMYHTTATYWFTGRITPGRRRRWVRYPSYVVVLYSWVAQW